MIIHQRNLTLIRFEKAALAKMTALAEKGYPYEICGLMLGKEGAPRVVSDVFECGNLNKLKPETRYNMDPKDYMKGEAAARAEGLDVVGFSTPSRTTPTRRPRPTDRPHGPVFPISSSPYGRASSPLMKSWVLNEGTSQFENEPVIP